ncbi:MAG: hypothetical protein JNK11_18610 [Alphaproteobacteria bacterium]|nr:hypothetical protein [Alphaproteobacteria bacterium]
MSILSTYPNTANPIADLWNRDLARPASPAAAPAAKSGLFDGVRWPSIDEVNAHMEAGRRLRAEHAARVFAAIGRGIVRSCSLAVQALRWFGLRAARTTRAE